MHRCIDFLVLTGVQYVIEKSNRKYDILWVLFDFATDSSVCSGNEYGGVQELRDFRKD
jgi:hypothetical protein